MAESDGQHPADRYFLAGRYVGVFEIITFVEKGFTP